MSEDLSSVIGLTIFTKKLLRFIVSVPFSPNFGHFFYKLGRVIG